MLDKILEILAGFFTGLSILIRRRWFQVLSGFAALFVAVYAVFGDTSSALILGVIYFLAVGIFGARLRSRKARYETEVREIVAGVVHGRRQAAGDNVVVHWREDRIEKILFSFPATKSGEGSQKSMEKRMRKMLPADDGKVRCDWRFKWNLRRRTTIAYPVFE